MIESAPEDFDPNKWTIKTEFELKTEDCHLTIESVIDKESFKQEPSCYRGLVFKNGKGKYYFFHGITGEQSSGILALIKGLNQALEIIEQPKKGEQDG